MSDLVMPKFGLTMTEGLLSEWHVAPGAEFRAGDLLFTVETEKVANEIEAETDGKLAEVLVQAGETVPVGTPIARVENDGAPADDSAAPAARPSTPTSDPAAALPPAKIQGQGHGQGKDTLDSPSARKLMAEHRLDRATVEPTGRDGRVMKEDVLRVIATPLARRLAGIEGVDLNKVEGTGPKGRIKARDIETAAQARPPGQPATGDTAAQVTEITPDANRRATAQRVSAAKRDIPHFYLTHEADMVALSALRSDLNADGATQKVSVTHMLIRALGLALEEMPQMNRIWAGDRIIAFGRADIGMVVETPDGLRIPVVRNSGGTSLDDVANQANGLIERARTGSLASSDVGDGVISISNVGMFGASSLTPIINPPNAMILGVGAERAVFRPDANNAPALRRELTLTLACDHRIIDGADAARFLSAVVALLENPLRLLRPARKPA